MILITGASKGIGRFLFDKFTENGFDVYGTYNSTTPETVYVDKYSKVDVSDFESVEKWINSISNKSNLILINCAGINYNCFAHKVDMTKWKKVVEVNLFGTFNCINKVLPIMREQEYGRIINFSSIVAQTGMLGATAYSASKSAMWGLSKSLAKENGAKNITVNNLNIGYFNIGIIRDVPNNFQLKLKEEIPSSKFGDPIEIFNTIKYLIDANYVNGTCIDINGGLY